MIDYNKIDKRITALEDRCKKLDKKVKKKGWLYFSDDVCRLQNEILKLYCEELSLNAEDATKVAKALQAFGDVDDLNDANLIYKYSDERTPESVSEEELKQMADDSTKVLKDHEVKMLNELTPFYLKLQRRVRLQDIIDKYRSLFSPE